MDKTRSRRLPLWILAVAFVLPSCASGPPPGPSPAQIAGTDAKTILIAPFNVVSSLPPELEGSTRMVSTALVEHLEAHGKKVSVIGFRAGRDLWRAATKEVRESGEKRNFENAARVYTRMIGEQIEFDVLLVPSLFIQNAKMRGLRVEWDGTTQKMKIRKGINSKRANLYLGNYGTLNVRAASIFVKILDRDGNSIQTKRSGLELIQHLEWSVKHKGGYSGTEDVKQVLRNNSPAIEDKERVRAGVRAVLSPFVSEEIPTPTSETPEVEVVPEKAGAAGAS